MLALLLAAIGASGCSTDEGGGASGSDGLLEQCSGTYTCEAGDDPFETTLHREGDSCLAGGLVLFPDGSLVQRDDPDVGPGLAWSGDRSGFAICNGEGECVTCVAPGSEAETEDDEDAASCHGFRSCRSLSPGSCSSVQGCYLTVGATLSTSDDRCAGVARSCLSYDSERRCEDQRGCDWGESSDE